MCETDESGSSLAYQYSQSPSYSERPCLKTQDKEKQRMIQYAKLWPTYICAHTYAGAY